MGNGYTTFDGELTEEGEQYLETIDSRIKEYILELQTQLKNANNLMKENNKSAECTELQQQREQQQRSLLEKALQKAHENNKKLQQENENLKAELLNSKKQQQKTNEAALKPKTAATSSSMQKKPAAGAAIDQQSNENDDKANCILIKNFNKNSLVVMSKAKEMIKVLARQMNITNLKDDDIKSISMHESKYYKRHNITPDRISLLVEFSCEQMKVNFLRNKDKLKSIEVTENLEVLDYVSEEIFNLYQYAKELLKPKGYNLVYWRNNSVYAKKVKSSLCEPIKFKTKQDVDAVLAGADISV